MKKILIVLLLALIAFTLAGCATPKIALEYRPENTMELEGKVFVGDFQYFPKNGADPAQIPNTALGKDNSYRVSCRIFCERG